MEASENSVDSRSRASCLRRRRALGTVPSAGSRIVSRETSAEARKGTRGTGRGTQHDSPLLLLGGREQIRDQLAIRRLTEVVEVGSRVLRERLRVRRPQHRHRPSRSQVCRERVCDEGRAGERADEEDVQTVWEQLQEIFLRRRASEKCEAG
jgi:hypothetical protein